MEKEPDEIRQTAIQEINDNELALIWNINRIVFITLFKILLGLCIITRVNLEFCFMISLLIIDFFGIYASFKIEKCFLYFYVACLFTLMILKLPYLDIISANSPDSTCDYYDSCYTIPFSIQYQLEDLLLSTCLLLVFEAFHFYIIIIFMVKIHKLDKEEIIRVKNIKNDF